MIVLYCILCSLLIGHPPTLRAYVVMANHGVGMESLACACRACFVFFLLIVSFIIHKTMMENKGQRKNLVGGQSQ